MSSTNSTTNYELSQFLGTDKPAWLADYNSDMGKIDAQMKLNADAAATADGKGDTNAAAIGTLANLTTTAKTNLVAAVNEVDTNADTAQETANTAVANAAANRQSIDGLISYLNLSSEVNLTLTASAGTTTISELKIRKNTAGTLYKFYGRCAVSGINGSGLLTITTSDTGLRPAEDITIGGNGLRWQVETGANATKWQTYTIHPDGTITFVLTRNSNLASAEFYFFASLTYLENFDDPAS